MKKALILSKLYINSLYGFSGILYDLKSNKKAVMKKITCLLAIAITLANTGCRKTGHSTPAVGKEYTGVVVYNICSHPMVRSTGSDLIGQPTFVAGNKTYHNVFAVKNICDFGNYKAGDNIKFRMKKASEQNCMYCMMAVELPEVGYYIEVIP